MRLEHSLDLKKMALNTKHSNKYLLNEWTTLYKGVRHWNAQRKSQQALEGKTGFEEVERRVWGVC